MIHIPDGYQPVVVRTPLFTEMRIRERGDVLAIYLLTCALSFIFLSPEAAIGLSILALPLFLLSAQIIQNRQAWFERIALAIPHFRRNVPLQPWPEHVVREGFARIGDYPRVPVGHSSSQRRVSFQGGIAQARAAYASQPPTSYDSYDSLPYNAPYDDFAAYAQQQQRPVSYHAFAPNNGAAVQGRPPGGPAVQGARVPVGHGHH